MISSACTPRAAAILSVASSIAALAASPAGCFAFGLPGYFTAASAKHCSTRGETGALAL